MSCCGSSGSGGWGSSPQTSTGSWYGPSGQSTATAAPDGPWEVILWNGEVIERDTYVEADTLARQRGGSIRRKKS